MKIIIQCFSYPKDKNFQKLLTADKVKDEYFRG